MIFNAKTMRNPENPAKIFGDIVDYVISWSLRFLAFAFVVFVFFDVKNINDNVVYLICPAEIKEMAEIVFYLSRRNKGND